MNVYAKFHCAPLIRHGRSVRNMSMNVYAKFHCAPLSIKKALGIFRELITTTTTGVAFWDPHSGSKNGFYVLHCIHCTNIIFT